MGLGLRLTSGSGSGQHLLVVNAGALVARAVALAAGAARSDQHALADEQLAQRRVRRAVNDQRVWRHAHGRVGTSEAVFSAGRVGATVAAGDELGCFNLGSTVVLLTPATTCLRAYVGEAIRLGQPLLSL